MFAFAGICRLASAVELPEGEITGVYIWQRASDDSNLRANKVSVSGKTQVVIHGLGLDLTPENNRPKFTCFTADTDTEFFNGVGPELDSDNKMNSNMGRGHLQYSLPSVMELFNVDSPAGFDRTWCKVSVIAFNDGGAQNVLECKSSDCIIYYRDDFTPLFQRALPQAIFFNIRTTFFVDTMYSQSYRTVGKEMPFRMGFIDSSNTNYEVWLDETSQYSNWVVAEITGFAGDAPVNQESVPRLNFHSGDARLIEDAVTTCNYDQSDCYMVKSIAVIDSLEYDTGYKTGGQELMFRGFRLTGQGETVITVDGETCTPILSEMGKEIGKCTTGSKDTLTTDTVFVGQVGLRRDMYESANAIDIDDIAGSATLVKSELLMSMEVPVEYPGEGVSQQASIISGFFVPPADNTYTFHATCDDKCKMYLSTVDKDPAQKAEILNVASWSSRGKYYGQTRTDKLSSDPVQLEEGKNYYIELHYVNTGGAGFVQVGVEIDQSPVTDHKMSIRETQYLQLQASGATYDTTVITIDNPDDGSFLLHFKNPNSGELIFSEHAINTKPTEWNCNNGVRRYFWGQFGSYITAEREMFDVDGLATEDIDLATKIVCTIKMTRLIDGPSIKSVNIEKKDTNASITVEHAEADDEVSTSPFGGSFRVEVPAKSGANTFQTADIPYTASWYDIREAILDANPEWRGNFELGLGDWGRYRDRKQITLDFSSYAGNPKKFEIVDSPDDPLTGPSFTTETTNLRDYDGDKLLYMPIPYDMVRTKHSKPQMLMTVDGLPAACRNIDCDYTYTDAEPEITGFTVSGNNAQDDLTITGTNFPDSVLRVTFADTNCDVTSISTTQIVCEFDEDLAAGSFLPAVTTYHGLMPIAGSVSQKEINNIISSFSPDSSLNPNGGTLITITGTGFPTSADKLPDDFSMTFSDSTECVLQSISSTQIICMPDKFAAPSTNVVFTLTFNSKSDTHNVGVGSNDYAVSSVTPDSVSPVLKKTLVIELDTTMTLVADDFAVFLNNAADRTKDKELNVYSVDNNASPKTISARFGGAWSGTYTVNVVSTTEGKFSSTIELDVSGSITNISPTSGSLYGGTIVEVTGTNFDTDPQNNPVNIGWSHCEIISSSETKIVFRTPTSTAEDGHTPGSNPVIVALKTSEEAECTIGAGCSFEYAASETPTLTSVADTYDIADGFIKLTFSGSGFGTDQDKTSVLLDGIEQELISVSNTKIEAKVINIKGTSVASVVLYTANGVPDGYLTVLQPLDFTDHIDIVSIVPQGASQGGTQVLVTMVGVGMGDQDTHIRFNGGDVCVTKEVIAYGKLVCHIEAGNWNDRDPDLKVDSHKVGCKQGTDTSTCLYNAVLDPIVTSITRSGNDLTITGTGLDISGFTDAYVSVNGVMSSSVSLVSDTNMVATFSKGVPFANSAITPVVAFKSDDYANDYAIHFATVSTTFTNSLSISSASSPMCSFAGGCDLTITGAGLTTAIEQDYAKITVCGQTCPLTSASSSSEAVCSLPSMPTIHSVTDLSLVEKSAITGVSNFGDNTDNVSKAFDGYNFENYESSSSSCHIGTEFGSGNVGVLTQVSFMMNPFDKILFKNLLKFQGSANGSSWTTIKTIDHKIHEGYNYINFGEGEDLPLQSYRYYRFSNSVAGGCHIGEIAFTGYIAYNSNDDDQQCTPKIEFESSEQSVSSTVTYQTSKTVKIESISPRWGSVLGQETVTFTTSAFSGINSGDVSIKIDNIVCNNVNVLSTTEISCVTGARTGLPPHTFEFVIAGYGNISKGGNDFIYVNKWSEEATWGYELEPIEGESVYIPSGLNLLVDIDETPILNLILVEGSLIFAPDSDPTHERIFEAHIIYINKGKVEIGTEDDRYTSKLTISLHGEKYGALIPIFGNKCIANYGGILDIHGVERSHAWTELTSTAHPKDKEITIDGLVDWQVGEQIMLAPTAYVFNEDEVRTIKKVTQNTSAGTTTIRFNEGLRYRHFSETETFDSFTMPMKGEVALLSRNVKFMGSKTDSVVSEYGAHIVSHCEGDDCLITRISYVEMEYVGQSFLLGRYPIHFHQIGAVHKSYIEGNSIYHTFNRALTIHGTHYLRVINNVAYDVLGHGYFIEDGVEENNVFDSNIIVKVKRSWSLLMTDQMSAAFFITNPNNIFRNNRAIAAERMGWWFSLEGNSSGPNFDENICPTGKKLGEFSGNHVHSNGMYGLRLFNTYVPKTEECEGSSYTFPEGNGVPTTTNEPICAEFTDLIGWKNGRSCAITKRTGCIRFIDFNCIDNAKSQIEFSLSEVPIRGMAMVRGGAMIGYSNNNSDTKPLDLEFGVSDPETAKGVTTSRQEFFEVNDVSFYRFNKVGQSALFTCSQCFFSDNEDDARTTYVSGLSFDDATVPYRLSFQTPFRGIVVDTDGSLTGLAAGTTVTAEFKHNIVSECTKSDAFTEKLGGLVCDPSVQVRRVSWFSPVPSGTFTGQMIKILLWDDEISESFSTEEEKQAYLDDNDNYTAVKYDDKGSPAPGWKMPFVTGHKYKVSWGSMGLDFESMWIKLEQNWEPNDKPIEIMHNHTDVRVYVNMTKYDQWKSNGELLKDGNYESKSKWENGAIVHYEDEAVQEIHYVLDGTERSHNYLQMVGARCWDNCLDDMDNGDISDVIFYWSDPDIWVPTVEYPNLKVPEDGEDVTIPPEWNLYYDLPDDDSLPSFGKVEIQGRLTFDPRENRHLKAKTVFIRGGELIIGEEGAPFELDAKITLLGGKEDDYLAVNPGVESGNKNILVAGKASLVGKAIALRETRLTKPTVPGERVIYVEEVGDWEVGDELGLPATQLDYLQNDYLFITAIEVDPDYGHKITVDRDITYRHFGSTKTDWSDHVDIDMRGEVFKLNRNVKVVGEDVETWGGQIVVQDYYETDRTPRSGYVYFDNIQVYNCSQQDTHKAALRFEVNKLHLRQSVVKRSTFHHGNAWGLAVLYANNIVFENNVWFSFSTIGAKIDDSSDLVLTGNVMAAVWERDFNQSMLLDARAGFMIGEGKGSGNPPKNIKLTANRAIAVPFAGFIAPGQSCSSNPADAVMLGGNQAHSINGEGWIGYKNQDSADQSKCVMFKGFEAWKVSGCAAVTVAKSDEVVLSHIVAVDTGKGLVANSVGVKGSELYTVVKDSYVLAESTASRDCPYKDWCKKSKLEDQVGWDYDPNAWNNTVDKADAQNFQSTCISKRGTITPVHIESFKEPVLTQSFMLPIEGPGGDAAFAGSGYYENVTFEGFNTGSTYCGKGSLTAITLNGGAPDIIPLVDFKKCKFIESSDDGFIHMFQPPKGWISVRSCGSFPCTGPLNTALTFSSTSFKGKTGTARQSGFQIIPDNPSLAKQFRSCKFVYSWNGYFCQNEDYGVLHFESLDEDAGKRNIYPVYVSPINDDEGDDIDQKLANKLNQFMEHTCDGIYPGLFRLGRFAALVGIDRFYNIDFTGTVPEKLGFKLQSHRSHIKVQVRYDYKNSFGVEKDGAAVEEMQFDDKLKRVPALTGGYCGENKYNTLKNSIHFTITSGCQLQIKPRNAIRANIRMQWTFDEFFAAGGTTKFVDRLAASLGIHASTIKVVSVYEGSVVVEFEIVEEDDGPDVDDIEDTLATKIAEETLDIGVTIIGGSVGDLEIDPTYWKYEQEQQEETTEVQVTPSQPEYTEEIYLKRKAESNGKTKTAAIIIIAAALVVSVILSVAAYIILKNKFQTQQEKNARRNADETISEGNQSARDLEMEKQYVPDIMIDDMKKDGSIKQNAEEVIEVATGRKQEQASKHEYSRVSKLSQREH